MRNVYTILVEKIYTQETTLVSTLRWVEVREGIRR